MVDQPHLDAQVAEIRAKAGAAQRIVFVSGKFDILHAGHTRLLRFASELGDFLLVGIADENHPGVRVPEDLRIESVQSISYVDHAFVLRENVASFIKRLQPAIVVKGKEFESLNNIEQDAVSTYGGRLCFGSGDVSFSSIELIHREFTDINPSSIQHSPAFLRRRNVTTKGLRQRLSRFSDLRVMVIGDLIVSARQSTG